MLIPFSYLDIRWKLGIAKKLVVPACRSYFVYHPHHYQIRILLNGFQPCLESTIGQQHTFFSCVDCFLPYVASYRFTQFSLVESTSSYASMHVTKCESRLTSIMILFFTAFLPYVLVTYTYVHIM